jgi:hypothetical protein
VYVWWESRFGHFKLQFPIWMYRHLVCSHPELGWRQCVGIAQALASQRTEFFGIAHEPFWCELNTKQYFWVLYLHGILNFWHPELGGRQAPEAHGVHLLCLRRPPGFKQGPLVQFGVGWSDIASVVFGVGCSDFSLIFLGCESCIVFYGQFFHVDQASH